MKDLKSKFLKQLQDLLDSSREDEEVLRELTGRSDPMDEVQALNEQHLAKARLDARYRQIKALRGVIARLDAGTYGQCEECWGTIGPARLKALPETTLCIGCKEAQEVRR